MCTDRPCMREQEPLLKLMQLTLVDLPGTTNDAAASKQLLGCVTLIASLHYDLTFQAPRLRSFPSCCAPCVSGRSLSLVACLRCNAAPPIGTRSSLTLIRIECMLCVTNFVSSLPYSGNRTRVLLSSLLW